MKNSIFRSLRAAVLGASVAVSAACNGLFEGIYDVPDTNSGFGFVAVDEATRSGRIYVDATSYEAWVYVDLHGRRVVTSAVGDEEPEAWDFAVHRYDGKTNGGSVLETAHEGFEALRAAGLPQGAFVADVWTTQQITVDMSHMMEGYLVYAESFYNAELSKWLEVDTSAMPPVYTASERVYLVRLKDATLAALRLTGYTDDAGVKGYLTIDYVYPFEF